MTARLAASAALLSLSLLASFPAPAGAEGPAPTEKGGVFPEVQEVSRDEEAKPLLGALRAAVEAKDEAKIVEAVKPMVTKRHRSFAEDLRKLVADKRMPVAAAAAEALGSQGEDKASAGLLVKVVQAKTKDKGFYKDILLKTAAIESLGRLGVRTAADAILDLAEDQRVEPTVQGTGQAKLVRACVRYFGLTKEKRAVSYLIEEVDQPVPKDPNGRIPRSLRPWRSAVPPSSACASER